MYLILNAVNIPLNGGLKRKDGNKCYFCDTKNKAMSNNLLKGKRGIITGALDENSIAWKVALKAHEQGAKIVLTNAPIAMRMGAINKLAEATGSKIIPADATVVADIEKLYTESIDHM